MSQDLILFLAANPGSMSRLALDAECAAIDRELRLVSRDGGMAFAAKWAVTVDEMMRHLVELQPSVIHFSGHGAAGAASGRLRAHREIAGDDSHARSGIYLEGENGGSQLVEGHALMKLIGSAAGSARIVVLNACYSETQAAALSGAVDCVVGMTGAIDDEAARSFAAAFYRALGSGRSVGNALDQAGAILAVKHPAYEHLPCCRTRSGVDAARLVLGERSRCAVGPIAGMAVGVGGLWQRRFEAVVDLCRQAQETVEQDPVGAALRARLAIEHLADYLYERELGRGDADAPIDTKIRSVATRPAIPPLVATHLASVQTHAQSILDSARMAVGAPPSFLAPCLDSLAIVVEWFLWEYLHQPDGGSGTSHADPVLPPPRAEVSDPTDASPALMPAARRRQRRTLHRSDRQLRRNSRRPRA